MSESILWPSEINSRASLTLRLTNTASHKKEIFVPLNPEQIKLYVCGPTVYDRAHIGNGRSYVVFDILYRLLRFLYKDVIYVRNLTDIDDKIILRAQEKKWPISRLTEETTRFFHEDMEALGNLPPTYEPKATDHIPQMINIIEGLIAKKHAYCEGGHVFFQVKSHSSYGALSHLDGQLLQAGARVNIQETKRHPHDFVLWKPSSPDEVGWESPWGRGRPGWHIECSAMSAHFLGPTFDIHGGGQDLIFPHHENEHAQSTCFHEKPFVSYWVHNAYLLVNGEKMSKSLGNFLTVHDLLSSYSGETIRYGLLSSHYTHPLNWTDSTLFSSEQSLSRLYRALKEGLNFSDLSLTQLPLPQDFLEALLDDLNTPKALSLLHGMAKQVLQEKDLHAKETLASTLYTAGRFMGFFRTSPHEWGKNKQTPTLPEAQIQDLIKKRQEARQARDFQKADEIREFLLSHDIALEDKATETIWRPLSASERLS